MMDDCINDLKRYSGEITDIVIAIRELAKADAKELSLGYFNASGEVSIKVKR